MPLDFYNSPRIQSFRLVRPPINGPLPPAHYPLHGFFGHPGGGGENQPRVQRDLDQTERGRPDPGKNSSFFIGGPRQTGKSFLIHRLFSGIRLYDLLDSSIYLALSRNPGLLEEHLTPEDEVVVIDEVQRLPELLNEVHRLIEKRGKGHCPRITAVCLFLRRSPSRPGRLYRHLSATGNRRGRGDAKRTRLQSIPARCRSM